MPPVKDLTGQKFGRLLVLERADDLIQTNGKHRIRWKCVCSCGNTKILTKDALLHNRVQSCGCLRKETTRKLKTTHGLRKSRIYRIWTNIKTRCTNLNADNYCYYGEKGVQMYSEWYNNFTSFYDWSIKNGYKDTLTIDRIDTKGNYEPSNCRWITSKEQQNNKLNNHYITYKGTTHTLMEWSKILQIKNSTLHKRINYLGWSVERAFSTPTKSTNKKET